MMARYWLGSSADPGLNTMFMSIVIIFFCFSTLLLLWQLCRSTILDIIHNNEYFYDFITQRINYEKMNDSIGRDYWWPRLFRLLINQSNRLIEFSWF